MTAIEKKQSAVGRRPQACQPQVRVSAMGVGALLFDPSDGVYDAQLQDRLRGLSARLGARANRARGMRQLVLGLNNLLVMFDPLAWDPEAVRTLVLRQWELAEARTTKGRAHRFEVDYGGADGPDLLPLAHALGLTVAQVIRLHSEASYTAATIGSYPGLAYLSGLAPQLQVKRLATPRMSLPGQSVIIAGAQAAILPMTAPSGWHALGRTDARLFDPSASPACLLAPGDTVHFIARKVLS